MPMSWKKKQQLFVDELVLDFLNQLSYWNAVSRNRQAAQIGVMQKLGNDAISVSSAIASAIPAAGVAPMVVGAAANMAWNWSYDVKYEARYACLNAAVMTSLETHIYSQVKTAAIVLSRCFRDYLENIAPPKALKILADCIAERMVNYMTKVANEETPASFWSSDKLIQGAFEGVSGRLKRTYRNTALETQEEISWLQTLFHHHVHTVEGLMMHAAFATQDDNGEWHFYKKKALTNPFEKYGLAIFPRELANHRIASKDRQGKSYQCCGLIKTDTQ